MNRAEEKKVGVTLGSLMSGWFGSVEEQGRSIEAQTLRVYTLQQQEDYFLHFMKEDGEAKSWAKSHLKNGGRLFLGVGLVSVMEAELTVLRAIKSERSAKVSISDLLADASGIELLRRMNVEVKADWNKEDMSKMSAQFVQEHLIGVQYREVGAGGIFASSNIEIKDDAPRLNAGLVFGEGDAQDAEGESFLDTESCSAASVPNRDLG